MSFCNGLSAEKSEKNEMDAIAKLYWSVGETQKSRTSNRDFQGYSLTSSTYSKGFRQQDMRGL